jgi:O-succinylbenzoate synthase
MRIEAITLRKLRMRLRAPFQASFGVITERVVVLVEAASDGVSGWGEVTATPEPVFTYESAATASLVIRDYLVPRILGRSLRCAAEVSHYFSEIRGHEMARAGIENAIWDIEAQQRGLPLATLIGGTRSEIACGVSIGIQASPDALVDRVREEVEAGYQRIKIKIRPGQDFEYLHAVRRAFPNIVLSVDANSAYTLDDAEHLKRFDEYNLLMIEQPLWWDDIHWHGKLARLIKTPICLDEPIRHARDVQTAIDLGAAGVINIKLGRVGGHSGAREIQAFCLANKVHAWCGGMLESGIGRVHNIAVSSLAGYTLPGDVSASRRYWDEDLVEPAVEVTPRGTIPVPTAPGLGYRVRSEFIERFTLEKETWRAH